MAVCKGSDQACFFPSLRLKSLALTALPCCPAVALLPLSLVCYLGVALCGNGSDRVPARHVFTSHVYFYIFHEVLKVK